MSEGKRAVSKGALEVFLLIARVPVSFLTDPLGPSLQRSPRAAVRLALHRPSQRPPLAEGCDPDPEPPSWTSSLKSFRRAGESVSLLGHAESAPFKAIPAQLSAPFFWIRPFFVKVGDSAQLGGQIPRTRDLALECLCRPHGCM